MKTTRLINMDNVAIASSAALSEAFDMRDFAMGQVFMPAAWTAASIGFYVSDGEEGTYVPLLDDNGNLVQIDSPAVDQAYSFPAEVGTAMWVKLWSQDGAGADANQAAARTLKVVLKS